MLRNSFALPAALATLLAAAACAGAPVAPTSTPGTIATLTPTPDSTPTTKPTPSTRVTPPPTPTPSQIPTARPSPTAPPSATPVASSFPRGSVIVTFRVVDEQYRVLLTDPGDIDIANRLLGGEQAPTIPNGLVVRGDPSVNSPWSWHIDPDSLEFADMTTEVCDGLPSYVEDGTLTSDRFCPWGAEVVSVHPANE